MDRSEMKFTAKKDSANADQHIYLVMTNIPDSRFVMVAALLYIPVFFSTSIFSYMS